MKTLLLAAALLLTSGWAQAAEYTYSRTHVQDAIQAQMVVSRCQSLTHIWETGVKDNVPELKAYALSEIAYINRHTGNDIDDYNRICTQALEQLNVFEASFR